MASIETLVRERILILDGAMGTMIQQYNLTEEDFRGKRFAQIPGQLKGNNDILCLTRPDVIRDIHRKYLAAGADIIETNTFNSTSVSMADYHVQEYVREINFAAVKLAREVADEFTALTPDKPRFVAGSIGPTNKTCSMSPDVNNPAFRALTYDELAAAYREQMEAMLEAGVDAQLRHHIFKEWDHQLRCGRVFAGKVQGEGDTQRNDRHPEILPTSDQPFGVFTHHFAIIINKANNTVTYQHHQHAPDVRIGRVSPQQYGDHNRRQDHNPAHGRRTALAEV